MSLNYKLEWWWTNNLVLRSTQCRTPLVPLVVAYSEEPANTHVKTHQLLGGEKREEALLRIGRGSTLWVPEFHKRASNSGSSSSCQAIYIAWANSPRHVYSSKTGPELFDKFRLQSHRPTDPLCGFTSHTCTQQVSWGVPQSVQLMWRKVSYRADTQASFITLPAIFVLQRFVFFPPANRLCSWWSWAQLLSAAMYVSQPTHRPPSKAELLPLSGLFVAEQTFSCACAQALELSRRKRPRITTIIRYCHKVFASTWSVCVGNS